MATVKENFIYAIDEAFNAAKLITKPEDKAKAYAAIAAALAQTGLVAGDAAGEKAAPVNSNKLSFKYFFSKYIVNRENCCTFAPLF